MRSRFKRWMEQPSWFDRYLLSRPPVTGFWRTFVFVVGGISGSLGFMLLVGVAIFGRPNPWPGGSDGADVPTSVVVTGWVLLAVGVVAYVVATIRSRDDRVP